MVEASPVTNGLPVLQVLITTEKNPKQITSHKLKPLHPFPQRETTSDPMLNDPKPFA